MDFDNFQFIGELEIKTPNNRCKDEVSIKGNTGNYEARMHVYTEGDKSNEKKKIEDFFENFNSDNKYTFDKENIINYLNYFKFEFQYQILNNYNDVSLEYWKKQLEEVNKLDDSKLEFSITSHNFDTQKRYYISSKDKIFTSFKGYILLPDISAIVIRKYKNSDTNKYVYVFLFNVYSERKNQINAVRKIVNKVESNKEEVVPEEISRIVEFNKIDFTNNFKIKGLTFEDKDSIEKQISKALKSGKHIILTGPPGTGKSKLAKQISQHYGVRYKMTTAISDWSTYETIGGYKMNRNSELYFDAGIFLSCFKDDVNEVKNEWLIIDEMNRADIDKAFGVFFSALAGDDVNLSFKDENNNNIEIVNENSISDITAVQSYQYLIPNDWRLIGTINTLDKASLYEMSYAFMRRFAFIPVSIPKNIDETLVLGYMNIWGISDINIGSNKLSYGLAEIWKVINKYRAIGPAILKDIGKYVNEVEDWISAIMLYVLPQFEGIDETEVKNFISDLTGLSVDGINNDEDKLIEFIEDFFGISF